MISQTAPTKIAKYSSGEPVMQSTNAQAATTISLIESLPLELLNKIIVWLSETQVDICGLKDDEDRFPAHTYITNSERCYGYYRDLLSLSSTSRTMRIRLGGVLFRNISLVRRNQIDSVLSTPTSRQLYSDKRTYHREFIKELIGGNIEDCSKSELARSSFKNHIIGDRNFKCYYEDRLSMCNFVSYLECDNELLNSSELMMFPNLTELRILDECVDSIIQSDAELPKLKFLAVHAQTLQMSHLLLDTLCNLRRLDLFLNYSDIPATDGIQRILKYLLQHNPNLVEVSLFLDQPYNLCYLDTINLLKLVASSTRLQKLTIRVKRRKSSLRLTLGEHELHLGYIGDEILKVFQLVEQLIIDISFLDVIKINPIMVPSSQRAPGMKRQITIVDRAVMGPKMTLTQKEILGTIIRTCGFTGFSFYYGEALEESHLHVLNIVTDFIRWMIDPISSHGQTYKGLDRVFIEKCWSVTDDSIIREHLHKLMMSGRTNIIINHFKVWNRWVLNSPRYRKRERFDLSYLKLSQHNVATNAGYYIGTSNMPTDVATFVTSQSVGLELAENYFWSIETSLCDFEQYCIRQRRSMLFG